MGGGMITVSGMQTAVIVMTDNLKIILPINWLLIKTKWRKVNYN